MKKSDLSDRSHPGSIWLQSAVSGAKSLGLHHKLQGMQRHHYKRAGGPHCANREKHVPSSALLSQQSPGKLLLLPEVFMRMQAVRG